MLSRCVNYSTGALCQRRGPWQWDGNARRADKRPAGKLLPIEGQEMRRSSLSCADKLFELRCSENATYLRRAEIRSSPGNGEVKIQVVLLFAEKV